MMPLNIRHDDWILVGDGSKAWLLRNAGDAEQLRLESMEVIEQDNPPTREQGTDRPGRRADQGVQQRSAMEETDRHRLEEQRFAGRIAEALYKAAHAGAFERLILVAPPKVLGDLRKVLHDEVKQRLAGTLDKTLTNHSLADLEKVLLASRAGA